jgi:hypothetical protein
MNSKSHGSGTTARVMTDHFEVAYGFIEFSLRYGVEFCKESHLA